MGGDSTLTTTRRSLHAVAELVLAGPQHAQTGEISLRALPGGFGTTHTPDLRVDGTDVVGAGGQPVVRHVAGLSRRRNRFVMRSNLNRPTSPLRAVGMGD